MLRKLHNKKVQKKIWIVLILFILPGFIIWGASSSIRSSKEDKSFVKIMGRKVSQQEFTDAMRSSELQLRMQFGEAYYQLQKFFDMNSLAWQRLFLLEEAKKRRFKVGDAELIAYIQSDPSFFSKGRFDKILYEQSIKYGLHMQARAFEEFVRQNLVIKKLTDEVTKEVKTDDDEIMEAYKKENEQISVLYLASLSSAFEKDFDPREEELKDYFSKNSLDFKLPTTYNLSYLSLSSKEQVKDLDERLEKKEPLENLAKIANVTIQETGWFSQQDPIPVIGWDQKTSNLLAQAEKGEYLPVLESEKNVYVLNLKDKRDPHTPQFEEVKDKIKDKFVKDKARTKANEKIQECEKLIKEQLAAGQAVDFEKISQETGLKSGTTDMFGFGSYVEGIGASDDLFTAGSNLKDGELSPVIEMPSGFYIIRLKERKNIDGEKFAKEKETFGKKILDQKKSEFFSKYLQELIQKYQR
jgi:parvulin-like peptidyl-prolyl isomerase